MGGRRSAIIAPSLSRWLVGDPGIGTVGAALGGRDRKERLMIAVMVVLLVVQAFFVLRMVIG